MFHLKEDTFLFRKGLLFASFPRRRLFLTLPSFTGAAMSAA